MREGLSCLVLATLHLAGLLHLVVSADYDLTIAITAVDMVVVVVVVGGGGVGGVVVG